MIIFNVEWRPLSRIQTLACFRQRTEQWNEHKFLWHFQSLPFLDLPCVMCTFLKHPFSYLTRCSACITLDLITLLGEDLKM